MAMLVVFCNYPEQYPIEVLDLIKLRIRRAITLETFYKEMRKYGIRRTRALIFQGCYERGEYLVLDEQGREIPKEEIEDKLTVNVYYFEWSLTMKYKSKREDKEKKKEHPVELELTVTGEVEKHRASPKPTDSDIYNYVLYTIEDYVLLYFRDYWHLEFKGMPIERIFDEYSPNIDEFRVDRVILKRIDEPLEGRVLDITFRIRRSPTQDFRENVDYANDLYPYMVMAVTEIQETIIAEEIIRELRELRREMRERRRRMRIETVENRIRRIRSITDVEELDRTIKEMFARGEIDEKKFEELIKMLDEYAEKIFLEQVERWCKRIQKAETEGELNKIMSRIYETKTWNSYYFERFRDLVEECERKKRNELMKKAIEKEKLKREQIMKRVYGYYRAKKEQIMKTDRKVRQLRRLITRVEKSVLTDEMKKELISWIEENIKKVCKSEYEKTMNTIRTYERIVKNFKKYRIFQLEEALEGLRMLLASVKARKTEFCEYYQEVEKRIRELIKELRKAIKKRVREEKKKEVEKILKMKPEAQYEQFKSLIEEAESLEELNFIERAFKRSEIYKNPKYHAMKVEIESLIRYRRMELIAGRGGEVE